MNTIIGATRKEMLRRFILQVAAAKGRGTIYKAMVAPVISEITTVDSDFCKQTDTIFILNTKIAWFCGNKFLFINAFESCRTRGQYNYIGQNGPKITKKVVIF